MQIWRWKNFTYRSFRRSTICIGLLSEEIVVKPTMSLKMDRGRTLAHFCLAELLIYFTCVEILWWPNEPEVNGDALETFGVHGLAFFQLFRDNSVKGRFARFPWSFHQHINTLVRHGRWHKLWQHLIEKLIALSFFLKKGLCLFLHYVIENNNNNNNDHFVFMSQGNKVFGITAKFRTLLWKEHYACANNRECRVTAMAENKEKFCPGPSKIEFEQRKNFINFLKSKVSFLNCDLGLNRRSSVMWMYFEKPVNFKDLFLSIFEEINFFNSFKSKKRFLQFCGSL